MYRIVILFITLIMGSLVLSQSGYAAGLKKWKDKDGQWHFGDVIPPEYAQQGHEEISKQGLTLEVQERAKTEAEIAEQKRLAAIEAEEKKAAEERARHDRILLDTFSSVDDIEMTRDGKIAAIDSRILLSEKRIEKLQEDLDDRIEAAAAEERAGNTPNDELLKDIDSLKRQIKDQEDFIKGQNDDKKETTASYEADIQRFNFLKSEGQASWKD